MKKISQKPGTESALRKNKLGPLVAKTGTAEYGKSTGIKTLVQAMYDMKFKRFRKELQGVQHTHQIYAAVA